jgi:hypothetical protein
MSPPVVPKHSGSKYSKRGYKGLKKIFEMVIFIFLVVYPGYWGIVICKQKGTIISFDNYMTF